MQSQENSTKIIETTPDDINTKNLNKSNPTTQVQKDSVITNQDLPDKRLRYGFTLVILIACLFVAAIYYRIINP